MIFDRLLFSNNFFPHSLCSQKKKEEKKTTMETQRERPALGSESVGAEKKNSLRQRIKSIVWDTLDRSPEERRFLAKIDFFILTWAGLTYFSKNLNTNNICKCWHSIPEALFERDSLLTLLPANAYVSGMKEELNVVGNEYQTFTTMWTM